MLAFLRRTLSRGRIAHAYLFAGMDGVGKRTVALAFAKALLCPHVQGGEACGACPVCARIDRGNHADVIVMAPEGPFIKIQAVRDLMELMAFRPAEGRRRVIIMDDADRLNIQAANALLKTLEEPPCGHVMILVTARMKQLPATILSRCQRLSFSPLTREEIVSYLVGRLGVEEEEAILLASGAGGSIRRALELRKDTYVERRKEILACLQGAMGRRPLKLLALATCLGSQKDRLPESLEILKTCFRDALVLGELHRKDALIFRDRVETIRDIRRRLTTDELLANVQLLDDAIHSLERNANKTLTLETTVFKLAL